ncbi:MAG: hypothetical protein ACKO2S_01240, partial [Burkholderiaceae bacterium]
MKLPPSLPISALSVSLIAQIHEYKGALRSMSLLTPERLLALRHSATLESVGAAVRLGTVQLSDSEVNHAIGMLKQRQDHDFSSESNSHPSLSSTAVKPYRDNVHDYAAELMAEYEIDELLLQQSSEVRVFNA